MLLLFETVPWIAPTEEYMPTSHGSEGTGCAILYCALRQRVLVVLGLHSVLLVIAHVEYVEYEELCISALEYRPHNL